MKQIATTSLRDAAVYLATLDRTERTKGKTKPAVARLLNLLRSGEITAGIHFAIGLETHWIDIPISHWLDVSTNDMRVIKFTDDPSTGSFKRPPGMFSKEVMAAVTAATKEKLDVNAFEAVLAACTKPIEVSILQSVWDEYQARNPRTSGEVRGRNPKSAWRDVYIVVGAYIIRHFQERGEIIKPNKVAEIILQICRKDGIAAADLPEAATLVDQLSKIVKKAKAIQVK